MGDSARADEAFCRRMLPGVSRTFALTIRLLPRGLEYEVLLAYLLCRIADTIEDSASLPASRKGALLSGFSCRLEDGRDAIELREAFSDASGDEELLAREADAVLREYRALPPERREAIRPWVQEMCSGMGSFVSDGDGGDATAIVSLDDLDRYCYYVAGTVGHLLTALFALHDGGMGSQRRERLESLATSFGLGLQLTNIIKDVADDRRRGVSFVPRDLLATPESGGTREALGVLVEKAQRHLDDALDYCTALPRRQYRMRLFCLTSLFFAARTLRLARRRPALLGGGGPLKISRGAVYRTVVTTHVIAPWNPLLRAYFGLLSGR